jgi:hypothetical protein
MRHTGTNKCREFIGTFVREFGGFARWCRLPGTYVVYVLEADFYRLFF